MWKYKRTRKYAYTLQAHFTQDIRRTVIFEVRNFRIVKFCLYLILYTT